MVMEQTTPKGGAACSSRSTTTGHGLIVLDDQAQLIGLPSDPHLSELAALPYAVVLFLLAVIAAAAWRMHAVSRRFSEPITQLVAASERLRRGEFRPSPALATHISELRRL